MPKISLRLSDEELARLDACAGLAQIDRCALLRRLVNNAYRDAVFCALLPIAAEEELEYASDQSNG